MEREDRKRSSCPNHASRGSICQASATKVRSNAPGGCQWSKQSPTRLRDYPSCQRSRYIRESGTSMKAEALRSACRQFHSQPRVRSDLVGTGPPNRDRPLRSSGSHAELLRVFDVGPPRARGPTHTVGLLAWIQPKTQIELHSALRRGEPTPPRTRRVLGSRSDRAL
jgi:hypothetical protein